MYFKERAVKLPPFSRNPRTHYMGTNRVEF